MHLTQYPGPSLPSAAKNRASVSRLDALSRGKRLCKSNNAM
jgi:hypothetical protein